MRPIDLARPYGLSSQAIRTYEDRGIIPAAYRTDGGHRRYGERHRLALAAFRESAPALGHEFSATVVQSAHLGEYDHVLDLLAHANTRLADDRAALRLVTSAVHSHSPTEQSRLTVSRPVPIGVIAHRIGVQPATIRAWEAARILAPRRDRRTGHRVYDSDDLRDAHLARQLRRGHRSLEEIATIVAELREHRTQEHLEQALAEWRDAARARGRALLRGTAAIDRLIEHDADVDRDD
ncbi:MerR family transcriptional regulator [Dietzia timorensis]|uniref:HTH merR-type domain-containing protein n=1 Tax=Dietzia timorensis TaxID=499555 RepID=A0A173LQ20_9ACTN|nr:MerR family transcriptional regulator [Dietzia timorensis]ANI94053.1 Hypothetical protein BJL86_3294 [Dietzia timorensis]